MSYSNIHPLYMAKIIKKGRKASELFQVLQWLTGYSKNNLLKIIETNLSYEEFFQNAPKLNPNRKKITGRICGVKVEEINEPLMQEIRYIDKLVDELAKGKEISSILRK